MKSLAKVMLNPIAHNFPAHDCAGCRSLLSTDNSFNVNIALLASTQSVLAYLAGTAAGIPKLEKGQGTAIVTGAVSIIFGVRQSILPP